jgi:O-antigen/teichoic acid export membrane protein
VSKKSLVKIVLVSGGNIINAIVGFAYLAGVAKALSLDSFGKYALLTSVLLLFSKVIDFGSNSIFVTKSLTEINSNKIINSFHTLKLIMLGVSIPVSLISLRLLGFTELSIYIIFLLGLVAYTVNLTFYAHLQKEEKFISLVLLNTLPALIKGMGAFLIFTHFLNIDLPMAYGIFTLSIFMDLLLIPTLPKSALCLKIDFTFIRDVFVKGIPSGISQLVQESWAAINNAIIKILYGFTDVGIFSMANKISSIFTLISLSIFTVLLPKNAKLKQTNHKYDINETILLSITILLLSFAAIAVAGIFLTRVFGEKFEGSIKVLDILIFTAGLAAINSFSENYFLVENITFYILFINTIRIVAFAVCVLLLTPLFTLEGLAYSNLISTGISLLTTILFISTSSRKKKLSTM